MFLKEISSLISIAWKDAKSLCSGVIIIFLFSTSFNVFIFEFFKARSTRGEDWKIEPKSTISLPFDFSIINEVEFSPKSALFSITSFNTFIELSNFFSSTSIPAFS